MRAAGANKNSTETPKLFNRIAVLRAERGFTRQALAEAVGVNYQTIGYLERSDYSPSLELAFRFSEVFALPIEMIFSRQPFQPMSTVMLQMTSINPIGQKP